MRKVHVTEGSMTEEKPRRFKIEKIIKIAAYVIIFTLCLMFIIRCFMVADKSTFDELYPTDSLRDAYADGEIAIMTVKVEEEIAEDGYFAAYAFYYCPEAKEVQCAVRWNNSVYEYTDMEVGHEYVFYFLNEGTGEKYPARAVDSAKKSIYNYRKLVADGVELGEYDRLTLKMEIRDGYESQQVIRYGEQPLKDYKIPKKILTKLGE